MKYPFIISVVIAISFLSIQTPYAGVLVTEEIIANGKTNLADPIFAEAANETSGVGSAVNYLLTQNPTMKLNAKADILRAVKTAEEQLPRARGLFSDNSSQKLYDSLIMYDIVPEKELFTEIEMESLSTLMKRVLDYYLDKENYAWEDEHWSLGTTAMRILTSCALYALNFQNDPDAERYLEHSTLYFEKNLENSIDDFGAWLPDSQGYAGYAMEYMIITAKALENFTTWDNFSNPRLRPRSSVIL